MNHDYDLGPDLAPSTHEGMSGDYLGVLRHVLGLKPQGFALEFGVASGRTLRMIAEVMPVIGFDSWKGLPEDWRPGFPEGTFACDPPEVPPNAQLVDGLFEDTLPKFKFPPDIGLCHFDADLYSSTRTILKYVGYRLQKGTICVFDEWHGYGQPGEPEQHEQRAWKEFVAENPRVKWEVLGHGPEQFAIEITRGI